MKKIKSNPSFEEEKILWDLGIDYVIGIDEVGRGAFAGPIFAASVVFPKYLDTSKLTGVNDSKLLKPRERVRLAEIIKETSLSFSVASVNINLINKYGIGYANKMAFRKVIANTIFRLKGRHFVLVDGFHVKFVRGIGLKNQKAIVKGDRKSLSIAAASILAKVERDRLMRKLSRIYPVYGFGRNKGYGTKKHREANKEFGLTKIHRSSFNLSWLNSG
ncbi:MAG: ribonuclease HII [Patescibacteria group bacterium]